MVTCVQTWEFKQLAVNCSQSKFVAVIWVLLGFLCHLLSDQQGWPCFEKRNKLAENGGIKLLCSSLRALLVFELCVSRKLLRILKIMWGVIFAFDPGIGLKDRLPKLETTKSNRLPVVREQFARWQLVIFWFVYRVIWITTLSRSICMQLLLSIHQTFPGLIKFDAISLTSGHLYILLTTFGDYIFEGMILIFGKRNFSLDSRLSRNFSRFKNGIKFFQQFAENIIFQKKMLTIHCSGNRNCGHKSSSVIKDSCLITALSFSAGYYSAPIFLQFKEIELYWGVFFYSKRSIGGLSFWIDFFWSVYETGCKSQCSTWKLIV